LPLARASRPSAAGTEGRVPRSADYTGGTIVVRERKGSALGVPRGGAAIEGASALAVVTGAVANRRLGSYQAI